jgi:hypothetical protein
LPWASQWEMRDPWFLKTFFLAQNDTVMAVIIMHTHEKPSSGYCTISVLFDYVYLRTHVKLFSSLSFIFTTVTKTMFGVPLYDT